MIAPLALAIEATAPNPATRSSRRSSEIPTNSAHQRVGPRPPHVAGGEGRGGRDEVAHERSYAARTEFVPSPCDRPFLLLRWRSLDGSRHVREPREFRRQRTALDNTGLPLEHLKLCLFTVAPEADIQLVLTDSKIPNGQVG
jgi:hypothetical protein